MLNMPRVAAPSPAGNDSASPRPCTDKDNDVVTSTQTLHGEEWSAPRVRTARRLIRDINRFLKDYDPPVENLDLESQSVVHVLWGWWVWLSEQAVVIAEAKSARRVASVSPLVRSIGEHADLMLWLSETRADGVTALHRQRERWQRQLWDDYESANGHGPSGVDQPAAPARASTELGLRLDQELKSIERRLSSFDGIVPYYVFRSLSDSVHASLGTSRVYAPVYSDGTGRFENEPDPRAVDAFREAMVIDCAARCCQAAMIFKREVNDRRLDDQVGTWLSVIDLEDLLPTRRSMGESSATYDEVAQLAHEQLSLCGAIRETLDSAAEGKVRQVEPGVLTAAIRRLIRASRDLSALVDSSPQQR